MVRIAKRDTWMAPEDELVPLEMRKRQLTWREVTNIYKDTLKDAQILKDRIGTARKKQAAPQDIAKIKDSLSRTDARASSIFNACVERIVQISLNNPVLGEKVVNDLLAWKPPGGTTAQEKFSQIWQAVAPALGKIEKVSAYHAENMLTALSEHDPRHERSAQPAPVLRAR